MERISESISKICTAAREDRWIVFLPALVVFYSFIKETKLADPFLYKYQTEFQNLTAETLNGDIYPYFAYTCLIAVIPMFLFTDIFLYKPTMYLEIIGQVIYRFFMLFMSDVLSQQIGHALWGISTASDIGFYSYIYGIFDKDQYKTITSWTRAGTMAGRTSGYLFGQLLILTHIGTYKTLVQINFYIFCIALIVCFFLPRISWKQVVKNIGAEQSNRNSQKVRSPLPISFSEYVFYRLRKLKSDFIRIYSNPFILKWSFWWAMATCMSYQVRLYYQTLLGQVQIGDDNPLNGFADAIFTFITTVFILLTNHFPVNWDKWGEIALVLISILDTVFLALFAQTDSVYLMYFCYILYRTFYQVMFTIAQWNIAKHTITDSYGLVFGVDSFIALIMQSIIMRVVTDKRGLGMQVRESFLVYAGLHALTAVIFLISVIYSIVSQCSKKNNVVSTKNSSEII